MAMPDVEDILDAKIHTSRAVQDVSRWLGGRSASRPSPQTWLFALRECPDLAVRCDYRDSEHELCAMRRGDGRVVFAHSASSANGVFEEIVERKTAKELIASARNLSVIPVDESEFPAAEPAGGEVRA